MFVLIGTAFILIPSYSFLQDYRFSKTATVTQGTVLGVSQSESYDSKNRRVIRFYPQVSFATATGEVIQFEGGGSTSRESYKVGQTVSVLYHTETPHDARLKNSLVGEGIFMAVFSLVGLVAIAFGVSMILLPLHRRRKIAWLKNNGTKITCEKFHIEKIEVSRRPVAYTVVGEWTSPTENKLYLFSSDQLPIDPTQYFEGRSLQAYVDPGNLKSYYVDMSPVPEIVG